MGQWGLAGLADWKEGWWWFVLGEGIEPAFRGMSGLEGLRESTGKFDCTDLTCHTCRSWSWGWVGRDQQGCLLEGQVRSGRSQNRLELEG